MRLTSAGVEISGTGRPGLTTNFSATPGDAYLVRVAARARGPDRPIYAALFAVLLAWAIHAGMDWDWEMPVVTLVFFLLGGFALANTAGGTSASTARRAWPGQKLSGPSRGAIKGDKYGRDSRFRRT